jgi:hypothetical protein
MKIKRVVEASLHSLSVKYGGSGKRSAREGPAYPFFHKSHAESLTSRRKSGHANSTLNGSATPLAGATRS